jgi:C-terminal processing protease CtpA/Prc
MRLVPFVLLLAGALDLQQTGLSRIEQQRVRQMLVSIRNEIRKNYYDPAFHGIDFDQHFKAAEARLEQATSLGHGMGIIAQALLDFDDSHLFFFPPNRTSTVDYGWVMQMVGNDCYIVAVRSGSDADKKGLTRGTRVLAIEGHRPTRQTLWKMEYHFYSLSPRAGLRVAVQIPGHPPRELDVLARVTQGKRVIDLSDAAGMDMDQLIREAERDARVASHRFLRIGSTVVWKMPGFDYGPDELDTTATEIIGSANSLILDMRGNPGGYTKTLERLASRLFDRELKIADLRGRKPMKPLLAKKHSKPFAGKIVALVDSRSASAAELLARLLQLEKRGIVLGDQTSGSVMQAYGYAGQMGAERLIFFGASITNADVIMGDGKSLEKVGVTPDELIRPTTDDLVAGRDPVLARAATILGHTLDSVTAGAMFPIEWR